VEYPQGCDMMQFIHRYSTSVLKGLPISAFRIVKEEKVACGD